MRPCFYMCSRIRDSKHFVRSFVGSASDRSINQSIRLDLVKRLWFDFGPFSKSINTPSSSTTGKFRNNFPNKESPRAVFASVVKGRNVVWTRFGQSTVETFFRLNFRLQPDLRAHTRRPTLALCFFSFLRMNFVSRLFVWINQSIDFVCLSAELFFHWSHGLLLPSRPFLLLILYRRWPNSKRSARMKSICFFPPTPTSIELIVDLP